MKARLGFAVSVSVDPDILIVDEVLAVGDAIFRIKCIEKMEEFRRQGKTILFVSHSLDTVKAFCTRAVWINEGVVIEQGDLGPVIQAYEEFLKQQRALARRKQEEEHPDKPVVMEKRDILETKNFRMFKADGRSAATFAYGEDIYFEFDYIVKRPMERLTLCFTITNSESLEIYMSDKQSPDNLVDSSEGEHHVRVRLKNPRLLAGKYLLSGELWNNDAGFFVGHSSSRPITIQQGDFIGTGMVHVDHELENV
jgi:teichoic acid transport system ATP-binding protein